MKQTNKQKTNKRASHKCTRIASHCQRYVWHITHRRVSRQNKNSELMKYSVHTSECSRKEMVTAGFSHFVAIMWTGWSSKLYLWIVSFSGRNRHRKISGIKLWETYDIPWLKRKEHHSMRRTAFTGAILYWWQMGDWGLVTKLRRGGRVWGRVNPQPLLHPLPRPRNFVTSPQSPICPYSYEMAPVNAVHRIEWDCQLRRLFPKDSWSQNWMYRSFIRKPATSSEDR